MFLKTLFDRFRGISAEAPLPEARDVVQALEARNALDEVEANRLQALLDRGDSDEQPLLQQEWLFSRLARSQSLIALYQGAKDPIRRAIIIQAMVNERDTHGLDNKITQTTPFLDQPELFVQEGDQALPREALVPPPPAHAPPPPPPAAPAKALPLAPDQPAPVPQQADKPVLQVVNPMPPAVKGMRVQAAKPLPNNSQNLPFSAVAVPPSPPPRKPPEPPSAQQPKGAAPIPVKSPQPLNSTEVKLPASEATFYRSSAKDDSGKPMPIFEMARQDLTSDRKKYTGLMEAVIEVLKNQDFKDSFYIEGTPKTIDDMLRVIFTVDSKYAGKITIAGRDEASTQATIARVRKELETPEWQGLKEVKTYVESGGAQQPPAQPRP